MSVPEEKQPVPKNEEVKIPDPEPEGPFSVFEVLRAELVRLRDPDIASHVRDGDLIGLFGALSGAGLKAISLSGGGIRSATFALGVVQSLACRGLLDKFDYLSTVSGGGYLGSWLSAWIRVEIINDLSSKAQTAFETKTTDAFNKKYEAAKKEALSKGLPAPPAGAYRLSPDKYKIEEEQFVLDALKTGLFAINGLSEKGIENVQKCLAKGEWAPIESGDYCDNAQLRNGSPPSNPEPRPVRHLREYSNYMTPKVGIFSADTWALFGIYLRNLFLNWTIYLPLIAAMLLLPAIGRALFFWLTRSPRMTGYNHLLLNLGMAAGALSLTYVASKLPSKNPPGGTPTFSSNKSVFFLGVLPQFILAFCSTTFWWNLVQPIAIPEGAPVIPMAEPDVYHAVIFSMTIFLTGYLVFVIISIIKSILAPGRFLSALVAALNLRSAIFGIVAAAAGGLLLRLVFQNIFAGLDWIRLDVPPHETTFFCIAVPIFLLSTLAQSALFVGLASGETTDGDREWVARLGGWILLAGLGWLLFNSGVLLWPIITRKVTDSNWDMFWPTSIGSLITLVSGILSLVGGFSSKFPVRKNPDGSRKFRFISAIPQVASGVFLFAILVGLSYVVTHALAYISLVYSGDAIWLPRTNIANAKAEELVSFLTPWFLLSIALALIVVGSLIAFFVNVNRFSLHGAYRDRLVRAYLGASNLFRKPNPFTGFDENDNRQLHRLKRQRPFHVLSATLNLVASQNLAWQNRKATSFLMTPLHCGSEALGYRATNQFSRKSNLPPCPHLRFCNRTENHCGKVANCQYPGKSLRLGTAMAISGAAADPNMGYYSSALVTFIMSLFNIRLGWWLGNTGCRGSGGAVSKRVAWFFQKAFGFELKEYYKRTDPTFAVFPLINETLGRTSEERRYLNITDGGHFENLALYEMIRRRCRLIVLSDAAADAGFTFGELANAIEKCKVDLGVEIQAPPEIGIYSRNASKKKKSKGKRYFIAPIIYPEQVGTDAEGKSWLLYCRPTLYGNEPADIQQYAATNQAYPHQSTGDQFFDERQFEAYRRLGRFTMDEILGKEEVFQVFRSNGLNSRP
jgi:hypothetical protein